MGSKQAGRNETPVSKKIHRWAKKNRDECKNIKWCLSPLINNQQNYRQLGFCRSWAGKKIKKNPEMVK
jgi:hypothetical protein